MTDAKTQVEQLVDKAVGAEDPSDAMRYSQAALNAANALIGMRNLERDEKCLRNNTDKDNAQ